MNRKAKTPKNKADKNVDHKDPKVTNQQQNLDNKPDRS